MSLCRRSLLLAAPALLPGLAARAQGGGQDGPVLVAAAADLQFGPWQGFVRDPHTSAPLG